MISALLCLLFMKFKVLTLRTDFLWPSAEHVQWVVFNQNMILEWPNVSLQHTWSKNLPAWFDSLDPVLPSFPLEVVVDELFHSGFPYQPGCPRHEQFRWLILSLHRNSGGITKSSPRGRSLDITVCKQWRAVRIPLNRQCSLRWCKTQTLFGLINMPKSKEKVVLKWGEVSPEVLTRSGLCFPWKREVVMAPVRFEGFCMRPSKPPNPIFIESLSFPLFLLHWALRESEGKGHVCVSSWELLGTTG